MNCSTQSVAERYEALAGDVNQRRIYYVARRRLQFLPEEWDRLPWWQARMYLEGVQWEFSDEPEDDRFEGMDDDQKLAALGVNIRRVPDASV